MADVDEILNIENNDKALEDLMPIDYEEAEFNEDSTDDLVDDYKYIRNKLRYSIAVSEAILKKSMVLMALEPSARVIEGCSTIIKTMGDLTDKMVDLHGKRKKIFQIDVKNNTPETDKENSDTVNARLDDILSRLQ